MAKGRSRSKKKKSKNGKCSSSGRSLQACSSRRKSKKGRKMKGKGAGKVFGQFKRGASKVIRAAPKVASYAARVALPVVMGEILKRGLMMGAGKRRMKR